jgi:hypothetical protein
MQTRLAGGNVAYVPHAIMAKRESDCGKGKRNAKKYRADRQVGFFCIRDQETEHLSF